ncbi:MAG: ubiquitin-like domain-containing protein [Anaerolineales bacterium]
MKRSLWLLLSLLLLAACQPAAAEVTILDGERIITLSSAERLPSALLAEAGIALGAADRLLYRGAALPLNEPLPEAPAYTLTVRRAVNLTLVAPDGTRLLQTSAENVGQALREAGLPLRAADRLEPPAETPLTGDLSVVYQPASELTISVDGRQIQARSSAATVGQALAEAGLPLLGLDYAIPPENAPLPADGQIRLVRVREDVLLTQTSLPYQTRTELTPQLELDQQEIIQVGEPGLAISRTRVRYEDEVEAARSIEAETVVRPPRDQVTGYGTQVVVRTAVVDGVTIEYWRSLQVYVTSYAPCGGYTVYPCYYYTSSRKPVQIGVVAVVRSWYYLMQGWPIYVPGYGRATIEDVGAGWPPGNHYWVDLGYTDDNYVPWSGWITIYFLTPVPENIPYILP